MGLSALLVVFAFAGVGLPGAVASSEPKSCPEYSEPRAFPFKVDIWDDNCTMQARNHSANRTRSGTQEISLVLMVPFGGALNDAFHVADSLVWLALQQIEDSGFLPGYHLKLYVADDQCSTQESVKALARQLTTYPPKQGIIGPGCSSGSMAVNDMLQYWNLLQVGAFPVSNDLSDHTRYPNYIRMTPSYAVILMGVYELLKYMGWKRIGIVRGNHDAELMSLAASNMKARLDVDVQYGLYAWTVLMDVAFTFGHTPASPVSADAAMAMVKRRDSRVNVLFGYEHEAAWIFCAGHRLGMRAPDLTWVVGSGWYSQYFLVQWGPQIAALSGGACDANSMFAAGYGALLIYAGGPIPKLTHELSGTPNQDIYNVYREECMVRINNTIYCGFGGEAYLFDSVWHFAKILHTYLISLNNTLESVGTAAATSMLYGLSLQSNYVGYTGRINFFNGVMPKTDLFSGSHGDRVGNSMARQLRHPVMSAIQEGYLVTVVQIGADGSRDFNYPLVWSVADPVTYSLNCSGSTCDFTNGWLNVDRDENSCPAGFVWSVALGCDECPAGNYAQLGDSSCTSCLEGTFTNVKGMTACIPCGNGTAAKISEATECAACDAGTFANTEGLSLCKYCPVGRFTSATGAFECDQCPSNHPTTMASGSREASACTCNEDFYMTVGTRECKPCMRGLACPPGSEEALIPRSVQDPVPQAPHPHPRKKYFTTFANPLSVYECLHDTWCPGGLPEACSQNRGEIACGMCMDGTFPDLEGACQLCAPEHRRQDVWVIAACLIGPLVVLVVGWRQNPEPLTVWHTPVTGITTMPTVVLAYAQIIGMNAVMNMQLPNVLGSVAESSTVTITPMNLVRPECSTLRDFKAKFSVQLLLPIFGAAICIAAATFSSIVNKIKPNWPSLWPQSASFYGNVYSSLYIAVAAATFQLFMCYDHPNGSQSLRSASYVLCNESEWSSMVVASGFAIAVFCIGSLALFATLLYVMPRYYQIRPFRVAVRFMLFRYRVGFGFWTVVLIVKGLWVTLSTVIFTTGAEQILWLSAGIIVYTLATISLLPWRQMPVNIIDVLTHCWILFHYNISSIWVSPEPEKKEALDRFNTIVVVAMYPIYFVCLCYLITQVYRRRFQAESFTRSAEAMADEILNAFVNVTGQKQELASVLFYLSTYERSLLRSSSNILRREWGAKGPLLEGAVKPRLVAPDDRKVAVANDEKATEEQPWHMEAILNDTV